MAAVKVEGMESKWLMVRGSVRQGCTLLFNLSIDSVVKEATGELVREVRLSTGTIGVLLLQMMCY